VVVEKLNAAVESKRCFERFGVPMERLGIHALADQKAMGLYAEERRLCYKISKMVAVRDTKYPELLAKRDDCR
jgi:hypothetical protein